MVGLIAAVQQGLADAIVSMVAFTPKVIAAFILLVIGLLAGKIIGKVVAKVLDSAQVDEVLGRTPIGEMLTHSGMTILQFLDAIARWFVYLIFIMAAVNVLEVRLFSVNSNERLPLTRPLKSAFLRLTAGGLSMWCLG